MAIEELIQRIRKGDELAASQFVMDYGEHIKREARRRMADERMARFFDQSDVFQSVILSFVLRVRVGDLSVSAANELLGLLIGMTQNKVADRFRKLAAQKRDYRRDQSQEKMAELNFAQTETPSQILSLEEQLTRLESLIPPEIKEVAELRVAGKSWEEIASQTGENSDSLRKRFSRAIAKIETEFEI